MILYSRTEGDPPSNQIEARSDNISIPVHSLVHASSLPSIVGFNMFVVMQLLLTLFFLEHMANLRRNSRSSITNSYSLHVQSIFNSDSLHIQLIFGSCSVHVHFLKSHKSTAPMNNKKKKKDYAEKAKRERAEIDR